MPIQELKQIIATQKSVSTSRLEEIVKRIEKAYIQQGQKINGQRKALNKLNTRYQKEKQKADKRRQMVQDYENLKVHHRNLEREFNKLNGYKERRNDKT